MQRIAVFIVVASCAALLALPCLAASAASGAPKEPPPELSGIDRQKMTVALIRNVGTAMFSWLTDQIDENGETAEAQRDRPAGCGPADKEVESAATPHMGNNPAPTEARVDDIPLISWEELRRILVPTYIQELPREDGWGHPFEFRLDRCHLLAPKVMAIRSAGSDELFDTDVYTIASFLPDETDQDLAWADGFFLRWPQRPAPPEVPKKK